MPSIALIGDYDPTVAAHRAIPRALEIAAEANTDAGRAAVTWDWIATAALGPDVAPRLEPFDALWCVPASPYSDTRAALDAIRFARESGRPFLGTCGGFQHALLEYALNVWRLADPAHAETNPDAGDPIIAPLECSLIEQHGAVHPVRGTRLAAICAGATLLERYHCRFGLSPRYAPRLESGPLRVGARDDAGDVRAIELDAGTHPFFIATLFQPERSALEDRGHPLISAFVAAAIGRAGQR